MRHTICTSVVALALAFTSSSAGAQQQFFPPGTFSIDGFPVVCGPVTFVADPTLPDVGMARPGYIFLNPYVFAGLPTVMKLYWAGHECGHHVVGASESAADCWSVRTGRDQGWFPPEAFAYLIEMFRNNPGDITHPPGPTRVRRMMECYAS